MYNPFNNIFESNTTVWDKLFLDKVFILAISLFAIVIIILKFINDPGKEAANDITPPGQVIIEIYWDNDVDIDIDGWVKGPADASPVGFRHRADVQFNLLRDDRGFSGDISGRNYENFYSRGVEAGDYIINVHWYSGSSKSELEIRVIISVASQGSLQNKSNAVKQILLARVKLRQYEDKNVVIFELDEEGELIQGTLRDDQTINLKAIHGVPNYNGDNGDFGGP